MYVVLNLPLDLYDRFVDVCPHQSRQYAVLKNGLIFRRGDDERFIEIWCIESDARMLLDTAYASCTELVEPIENALASPRQDLHPIL